MSFLSLIGRFLINYVAWIILIIASIAMLIDITINMKDKASNTLQYEQLTIVQFNDALLHRK